MYGTAAHNPKENTVSAIYDDGATYGPDPDAIVNEPQTDPIYDDGDVYGQPATQGPPR
ncbi:hypothetical protein GA0115253_1002215 [Streptomyces sp. Termitarium-T10T-6]|nr:hypothetical protein GA0115253_1002215 [Streptomyces sp. Termitarium-T10T-6]